MTSAAAPANLPFFGPLSPFGRVAVVVTLAVSLVAIGLGLVLRVDPSLVFVVSGVAILGQAWVIGLATERLGALTGPRVGGIINATFGNIAELIIGFFALQAGLVQVVKASITGSIIGNLLLVLGASVFLGGLRHGTQRFNARIAGSNAALLVLAAVGLFIPAIFALSSGSGFAVQKEQSGIVSVLLIAGYVASLVYQFTNPEKTLGAHGAAAGHGGPSWTVPMAVTVLLVAAALLAVLSEILVGSIEPFVESFGLSAFFVGIVIIPTIGNLAEHIVSVQLAVKDRMEFAMAVCYGSSLQVALFVAPVLVLLGFPLGQPMDLVFHPLEIAAVAAAVAISALITLDGESNWLEGLLLMLIYVILAGSFFELRGPDESGLTGALVLRTLL